MPMQNQPQTQAIKDEFFKFLLNSKMFGLLKQQQQDSLMKSALQASDEQLVKALLELKKTEEEIAKQEEARRKLEDEKVELAAKIKEAYDSLQKRQIKKKGDEELVASAQAADELLKQFAAAEE